jgi:hypothetical protein
VQLVYVDESYCNVCYYVVALLVPDTEAQALTTALNTVVRRATASYYGIGPTAELHGYDPFQGKATGSGPSPRHRILRNGHDEPYRS